jgi:hypothetical protein
MSSSSGGFFSIFSSLLDLIFGKSAQPAPTPSPSVPADNADEPAPLLTNRVLLLIYNPVMEPSTGKRLAEQQGWHRPEDLVTGYAADILQASKGMARYEIVKRIEVDAFPVKVDGFRYTPESYLKVLRGEIPPHTPQEADYQAILDEFDILRSVERNEIDEVWIFAFPHAGLYESTMGGSGAFWCNAPPLKNTSHCPRRFIIMGFSYERSVGEMLESFSHRTESIMEKTFSHLHGEENLWERFTRYDKIAPGKAEVGTVHYAPNSERDYDWGNPRFVPSNCYDWYNFPHFKGDIREVNAAEWGNGDIRLHHQWWLKHIPHVAGRINGIHNDWWQYILDPNRVQG